MTQPEPRDTWAGHTREHYADVIMGMIRADMAQPFAWGAQIPADVPDFSALHDYCDANEYMLQGIPADAEPCDCTYGHVDGCTWDDYMAFSADVCNMVDARIRAGELAATEPANRDRATACTCVHGIHGYGIEDRGCRHPGCDCTGYFPYVTPPWT